MMSNCDKAQLEPAKEKFWPASLEKMLEADYKFVRTDFCTSCKKAIELWITPKGKWAPFVVDGQNLRTSHFADCKFAKSHRRRKG